MKNHSAIYFFLTLFVLIVCQPVLAADSNGKKLIPGTGLPSQEVIRLGEQMYRSGILPSGEPMQSVINGDVTVEGTAFSCISCHLRGGLGSFEGTITTPPTNGKSLFSARYDGAEFTEAERAANVRYLKVAPRRPAYTDETLAAALRGGMDAAGQMLNPVMPRYYLQDRDMAILLYYLRTLSSDDSPGVSETTIRFATVITDGVSSSERNAMLGPLENYITARNNQVQTHKNRAKFGGFLAESMDLSYRQLELDLWELKGPQNSWGNQLEEYYRKKPVFALIGGITNGEWKPVHDFSEANRIPTIFPITDFPVISDSDWYTLYLSRGLYQEGETAARSLARMNSISKNVVVQIFEDSLAGRTISAGFRKMWHELKRNHPVDIILKPGEKLTADAIRQLTAKQQPAVVLLWTGPETLPALAAMASMPNRPEAIFVSAGLLTESLSTVPEEVREYTYITYPYRLAQDEKKYSILVQPLLKNKSVNDREMNITSRTYSLLRVLTQALMHMRRNFYRDNFLDVISMLPDQVFPVYERLSFGPGQRYASKGCYIVRLSNGPKPELIRISDWVVH